MPILRDELHRAARLWNLHRIQPSTNVESPSGRPDVLFFLQEVSGTRNYMVDVELDELDLAEDLAEEKILPFSSFIQQYKHHLLVNQN